MSPSFPPSQMYWLSGPALASPLLAGGVEYREATKELCFFDSVRPRALALSLRGPQQDGVWTFVDAQAREVQLKLLDVATFDRVFRPSVHGAPPFANDAALQTFYAAFLAREFSS